MNKKTLIFLLLGGGALMVLCGCIAVIAISGAFGLTQPAADTGGDFMTALREGNFARAYGLCHPNLQAELGSAEGLAELIVSNRVEPVDWDFSSRDVSGDNAELSGSVTFSGDRQGALQLVMVKSGDSWSVAGFNFQEQ